MKQPHKDASSDDLGQTPEILRMVAGEQISLQALVDWVPDFLWIKDTDSRFILANKALAISCGRTCSRDMIGLSDFDIHSSEAAAGFRMIEQEILRSGVPIVDREEYVIPASGVGRWLSSTKVPLRNEQNEIYGLLGIARDITDRKVAEQRQIELVEKLTRTNEELNNFTYVASHDLKSPLRGIDQLATWIAEDLGDTLGADTQEHLRLMRSRINRMEMLLDDLLAYSRVGRVDDEIVEVNTRELVQDIFEIATSASRDFRLIVADDMPVLQTKKVPLELVFRNLVGNAIKHHDKAQGKIDISARRVADGVEFEVKDDGPGIPLEHQKRVFGMFKTLKSRDEIEGSGIGLALVKKVVESMGSTITLESDGQQGCVFKFTWPTTNHKETNT